MRRIGIITVARSDYGIYVPLLEQFAQEPLLSMHLFVTGMHLLERFGDSVRQIEQDGWPIAARVSMTMADDSPEAVVKAGAEVMSGFANVYARQRPDILIALGDRFEMHAAVVAAVPFNIPVAHLHGGESTHGAIDEVLRHSITKLAHVHFVAAEPYARRILQMGEDPKWVFTTGALGLETLRRLRPVDEEDFRAQFPVAAEPDFLLVTYHPVTRGG